MLCFAWSRGRSRGRSRSRRPQSARVHRSLDVLPATPHVRAAQRAPAHAPPPRPRRPRRPRSDPWPSVQSLPAFLSEYEGPGQPPNAHAGGWVPASCSQGVRTSGGLLLAAAAAPPAARPGVRTGPRLARRALPPSRRGRSLDHLWVERPRAAPARRRAALLPPLHPAAPRPARSGQDHRAHSVSLLGLAPMRLPAAAAAGATAALCCLAARGA